MTMDFRNIAAFFSKYKPLSKARLAKMIYLADWKYAVDHGEQITCLHWKYDHYGPYLREIYDTLSSLEDFQTSSYGNADMIKFNGDRGNIDICDKHRSTLQHVIETTKTKSYDDFLQLVYSTYPIRTQPKYSNLNLVKLADEYKQEGSSSG